MKEEVELMIRNSATAITNLVAVFPFTHDELEVIETIIKARYDNKRYVVSNIDKEQK